MKELTSKEALETVKDYLLPKLKEDNSELGSIIIVESVNVLEKLVESDTPKKIEYDGYNYPCCPVCNSYASGEIKPNYCWNCGTKFVWTSVSKKENVKFIRKIKGIRSKNKKDDI